MSRRSCGTLLAAALVLALGAPQAHAAAITRFSIGNGQDVPALALGPDGRVWFSSSLGVDEPQPSDPYAEIGTIGADGSVNVIRSVPTSNDGLPRVPLPEVGLVGPDGAFWTDRAVIRGRPVGFARTTTAGDVTTFPDRMPHAGGVESLIDGPGGTMWFTTGGRKGGIGQLTTSGQVTIRRRGIPPAVLSITEGPKRSLWFTFKDVHFVERMTAAGKLERIALPHRDFADEIAEGADGDLWTVTPPRINTPPPRMLRITPKGKVTERCAGLGADTLTAAPDGHLWFVRDKDPAEPTQIVRLDAHGNADAFTVGQDPSSLVFPRDGSVWLTAGGFQHPAIERVDPAKAHHTRICTRGRTTRR